MRDYVLSDKKKSDICQTNCKDCEQLYVRKTKRDLGTRAKEQIRNIKKMEKLVVAQHMYGRRKKQFYYSKQQINKILPIGKRPL